MNHDWRRRKKVSSRGWTFTCKNCGTNVIRKEAPSPDETIGNPLSPLPSCGDIIAERVHDA